MAFTKPTGEQISFRSSKTGTHNLDTYLEACEKGTVSLPAMLDELFGSTGELNPNAIGFRVSTSSGTPIFQARFGTFTDATSGWFNTDQSFFHWRGDYAASTAYKLLDMVRLPTNESIYICTVAHTSTGTLDTSKFQEFFDGANVTAVVGSLSNINSVAANQTNINSLATALGTITTYAVTVASVGGSNKYHLDGTTAPTLSFFRGNTYTFDLSDSSNAGHPLAFKDGSGNNYTTGVVTSGTPGSSGATVTLTVASNAPSSLSYYCTVHGVGMGNTITVSSSNLSTVASNISGVNTVSTNISAVNTVAGVASTMSAAASNAAAAANSAAAAANSASAAATAFDTFDDRYLGSKSSEPSTDNDGNALVSGALFFDSSANAMKVYDGSSWITATSAGASSLIDYEYTATAGQTTFTGADNNSATLTYTVGNIIVSLNGVILDNGSDYTATTGSSIVLASAAASGDHLAVVAFKSFSVSDTVSASAGGTFGGGVTVNGTLTATELGLNINSSRKLKGQIATSGSGFNAITSVEPTASNLRGIEIEGQEINLSTNPYNQTAAATRFNIGSAGQLGVGGANYGNSGQVLTSSGSGAAPSWVEASGGGEQTFTATGAITAGQPVGLNPNGTISAVSPNQSGLLNGGSSNMAAMPRMDYDTAANKLIICSRGPGSGYSSYVEVVTPAANLTASFGTPVLSRSANTREATPAFDPATGRTNILFVAEYSNYQWLYAVSGIVSGTSMTFGSLATGTYNANGDVMNPVMINAGANKSVVVARQYASGNYQSHVYVLTTSGTSISFNSPDLLDAGIDTAHRHGAVYDSNAGKVVFFYQHPTYASYAKVGTISGTSISFGSRATTSSSTFRTGNSQYYPCFDTNSNKIVLATPNALNNKPTVIVGTVSGTNVSFGTPVIINEAAADASNMYAAFDSSTNTVLISYYVSSGDPGYWLQRVKVNGTSVDVGAKISLSPNSVVGPVRYADDIDRMIVLKTSSGGSITLTNPSAPAYVGLAKENISNGATGKVTVIGGINESQSNLISGFPYGLAPTSTAISVGPSNKIGTALSATKIYLSEGSI